MLKDGRLCKQGPHVIPVVTGLQTHEGAQLQTGRTTQLSLDMWGLQAVAPDLTQGSSDEQVDLPGLCPVAVAFVT